MNRTHRTALLKEQLKKRILVLDGAMGTAIQDLNLTAEDFGGPELEGCNEHLVLTRPEVITSIHEAYLRAGADIIETDTFGATPVVLDEFGLADKTQRINEEAARVARRAAEKYSTPDRPRFVAGSIGPTTKAISVTGGISFQELVENFYAQASALYSGGADYFLIETCQDTRNVKAALLAIRRLFETEEAIPVAVSGTIEPMGTMLAGQTVEAFVASLAHEDLLYVGLNCATGPEFMTDHLRSMAGLSPFAVACVPNAGLPDEDGNYLETPAMMSEVLSRFIEKGWVNLLGGCCGTRADHTAAFAKLAEGKTPRAVHPACSSFLSGLEFLEVSDDVRPVLVGERTNVIGSRMFKQLIVDGNFEQASEIARSQVKMGAQIIDVCLANPDRDEKADMKAFMEILIQKVKVPFMIDSTDPEVIDLALSYCQGKSIINSVNLEDGEERFEQVVPIAKKYGAALVVGTIDDDPEQGMGVSRERKLQIATRSYDLLVNKYGVAPEDIYWDPLVFPCGTGDANYVGSAEETVEGIRLIKAKFPKTRSVLGISNVSFGLPPAGREVLNAVFLYHCVQAGLDLAIVNSQKLERFASISDADKTICDNLLFNRTEDPVAEFAAHFRSKKPGKKKNIGAELPLDERLANYIVEGSKDGLVADLDLKLKDAKPLEIINGPLMAGMDEVGRLFNDNKLIVAEVLQSAEAMKAAVAHLEPHMEMNESSSRGKVLLATVKGDVHDIGKNLVDIILTNNGFEVINLGIKVPPQSLIEAIEKYNPDIVGLSGLLVKSAQQMVVTASDFAEAGIKTPIIVGGAALSEGFVDKRISKAYATGTVAYAPDAMKGLELAKTIVDPDSFESLKSRLTQRRATAAAGESSQGTRTGASASTERSTKVDVLADVPHAPDLERHLLLGKTPIDQIWKFINPMMLYGRHLGVRGKVVRLLNEVSERPAVKKEIAALDPKAFSIWEAVEAIKSEYRSSKQMRAAAVYQFFKVYSKGNSIHFVRADGTQEAMEFPRQSKSPNYCLADFVSPDPIKGDTLGVFAVTVGSGIREEAEKLKQAGDYLRSHILQALALESAEAYAEFLHAQMRRMWGFGDSPETTMLERFQAKYRGKRYSFGYPACPRLSDQERVFALLRPEEIGIQLTDGFMMDPEASVTALVFHHPQAAYFSVGQTEDSDEG
ncbi:MAG: methionine synthase [Bdellovibrionales bacterium]|nr:methionine synthase [Bdellovibrionales bacterium]